jgi:hypothetical protein
LTLSDLVGIRSAHPFCRLRGIGKSPRRR